MKRRILLVAHDDSTRDDRASQHFAARGHEIAWTCPALGGELPAVADGFDAVIVYGGVESANSHDSNEHIRRELDWIGEWLAAEKAYLGLCLGSQLLAHALGARVAPHPEGLHERGFVQVTPTEAGRALMAEPMHVYQSHQEGFDLAPGAELLFTGATYPYQGFRYGRRAYGFQFHPECTPEVMVRWMEMDGDKTGKPGAHGRERQLADSKRYDAPMGDWFEGFLARWIADEF